MGQSTPSITRLLARISSTTPPRPRRDLNRSPRSVPTSTQLDIVTFLTEPLISLPKTIPPWPCSNVQLVMVIFSHALSSRRPSSSLPDLIVMQSSPTSTWQLEMCTLRHESGLMPSVLGEFGGFLM